MMSALADRVVDFVREETTVERYKLHGHTRLRADLEVDGDDAVELMLHFQSVFEVDCSDFFAHFADFFGPEPNLISAWQKLVPRRHQQQPMLKQITIQDLIVAAEAGRLEIHT